jgi:hypothetical protein
MTRAARVEVSRADLERAASEGLIAQEQIGPLWNALAEASEPVPGATARFDFVHLAWYFGALLVIAAMGFFMTLGWESLGGAWIFSISAIYALGFVRVGRRLWRTPTLRVPAGLLVTMAVCMTPLGVYGLERWLHWWPDTDPGHYRDFHEYVKGGWILMEYSTIAAALVALRFFRFSFLTAPIAFTLWYISMDLAPLLFGGSATWNQRAGVSAAVGLATLMVSFLVDLRARDLAFWGYLFGLMAFWGGLVSLQSDSELNKALFFLLNLGLMALSIPLGRRVFLVFGSLGAFGYLGYLSWRVFEKSIAFPFVLSAIGIGVIFLAVRYHRNRAAIDAAVSEWMPAWLRRA